MSVGEYGKKAVNELANVLKDKFKKFIITQGLPIAGGALAIMALVAVIAGAAFGDGGGSGDPTGSGGGKDYMQTGSTSVFYDNSFTKDEFVKMAQAYVVPHETYESTGRYKDECYKTAFADMAGDYFDISVSYGFDPRATFCTGIQESAYGTSDIAVDKCNYWGIGAEDDDPYNKAYTYSSISEGITALCELWKIYTTNGSWHNTTIKLNGYDPNTIEGIGVLYSSDQSWANQKINLMKNIFGFVPKNVIDTSSFLSTAQGVWQQVCDRFTTYGNTSIVPTGTTIDCSAYVDWVLVEYGYSEFEGPQTTTEVFYNTNWNEKFGWTEIAVGATENVIDKVQPGDLLVRYNGTVHHITIIVKVESGTVYVYDCGQASNWLGKNGQPITYTSFITAATEKTQAPGKIIRVTKR